MLQIPLICSIFNYSLLKKVASYWDEVKIRPLLTFSENVGKIESVRTHFM